MDDDTDAGAAALPVPGRATRSARVLFEVRALVLRDGTVDVRYGHGAKGRRARVNAPVRASVERLLEDTICSRRAA